MHLGVSVGAGGRQMSEVPSERHSTDVSVAKDEAWRKARSAQQAWAEAMRMHQLAPPTRGSARVFGTSLMRRAPWATHTPERLNQD
jgi:hypothetical protein